MRRLPRSLRLRVIVVGCLQFWSWWRCPFGCPLSGPLGSDRVRKHFWPGFLRLFTQIKLARAFAVGNEAYAGRGRIREPEGRGG